MMNIIYDNIPNILPLSPKRLMNLNLLCQGFISFIFLILALMLSRTANVGFQVVITSFSYGLYTAYAFYVINKKQDPISVGMCIGAGIVMSLLSFFTAIYWGELSRCEEIAVEISKYTCDKKQTMKATCTFSVFMFLLQTAFTIKLNMWKTSILAESLQYSELGMNEADDVDGLYPVKEDRSYVKPVNSFIV